MTDRPTPDEEEQALDEPAAAETDAAETEAKATSSDSGDANRRESTDGVTETATESPAAAAGSAGDGSAGDESAGDESAGGDGDVEVTDELQAAADALEVDLELLLSERAQYLDAYRRAQADFENYRKQAQKRQDEAVVRALGSFVEKLLPVLDACDAALAHGASEVEPVLAALYGALGKEGLERIDPKGAPFDPAEAEAVVHEPGEGGEQIVSEVLRAGYRWRGRVLRPAMVKVTD